VTLRQIIEQEIRRRGPMSFSRYMDLCLYHPELGFYSRKVEQFGKAGDFYTSSDVHAVFGRLLTRQFDEIWRVLGSPAQIEILELGPGRGLFAQDVLEWSRKKFSEFFHAVHYSLSERSPVLRERLRARLAGFIESGTASLVQENTDARSQTGKGTTSVVLGGAMIERALPFDVPVIVIANEFFDALPLEILSTRGALRISAQDNRFAETWAAPASEELEFLDHYSVHPEPGERIEVALLARQRMARLAALVRLGVIIAIDYGYTRQEQLAGRHRGTLMAYRQHSATPSPYEAPGEQDLTAHVNFTALGAAAEENGMQVQPLLTQSQFLMGIGEKNQFADAFEDCRLPQERAKVALQLKHLVTPAGMGETFHVLVASKGVDAELVAGLSGLSFAKTVL
jgi:SAM-dependent MidA family methyltransferase